MQPRMKNPAALIPGATEALQSLYGAIYQSGVPAGTLALLHLRASQINGCSACVDGGVRSARKSGESDDRIIALSAWRDCKHFNDAERAAIALAEAVTRLSDQGDPVPDSVWTAAAAHYDEKALAGLLMSIATTNLFNRLNVPTKQVAGAWG